jgi:hypothetical protein
VKLFHKRLLILFSVALNIGFVIMAIVMMVSPQPSSSERSYRAILDIVRQLDLPEDQECSVLDTIQRFRHKMDRDHQGLKAARGNIVGCLAADGPVDRSRLDRLTQALNSGHMRRNAAVEEHFLDLRNQLGDQKGARFFTLLLKHHDAKDSKNHP